MYLDISSHLEHLLKLAQLEAYVHVCQICATPLHTQDQLTERKINHANSLQSRDDHEGPVPVLFGDRPVGVRRDGEEDPTGHEPEML